MQLNIHTKVTLPHQTQEIAPEKDWYLLRLPQHPETIQLCINRQLKSLIYFSEREDKETSSARIKSYTTESLEVQRITVTLLWIPRWVWLMQSQILAPLSVDPLSPKTESHLGPGMVSIMWNNTTISRWFLDLYDDSGNIFLANAAFRFPNTWDKLYSEQWDLNFGSDIYTFFFQFWFHLNFIIKYCKEALKSPSDTYHNPKFSQRSCNAFRTSTISIHNYDLGPVLQIVQKVYSETSFPHTIKKQQKVHDIGDIIANKNSPS